MRWLILCGLGIAVCIQIPACKSSNESPAITHGIEPLANAEVGDVDQGTGSVQQTSSIDEPPLSPRTSNSITTEDSGDPPTPTLTTNTTHTDPSGEPKPEPEPDPEPEPETGSNTTGPSGDDSVQQLCVDTINNYRASIGLSPYARWKEGETCADSQAKSDAESGQFHGAFGDCNEYAQNECPKWSGTFESVTTNCLAVMWAEGPGQDFLKHGHYINMSKTAYSKVACGYYKTPSGLVWAVQNFR